MRKEPKAIVVSYLSAFIEYMRQHYGCDPSELLLAANIEPALLAHENRFINRSQYIALINYVLHYVEGVQLSFDLGVGWEASHHGALGLMTLCGFNARQTLKAVLRFQYLQSKLVKLTFVENNDQGILTFTLRYNLESAEVTCLSTTVLAAYKLKLQIIGSSAQDELHFKVRKPTQLVIPDLFSGINSQFNSAEYRLIFPSDQLSMKLKSPNKSTYNLLNAECEKKLIVEDEENTVEERLRVLFASSDGEFPNLEEASKALHTSTRTLCRQLKKAGSNYQCLLDEARINRIQYLLKNTTLSVTDIAYRLHFPDSSYLGKLFKRHVGLTPHQYRKENASCIGPG